MGGSGRSKRRRPELPEEAPRGSLGVDIGLEARPGAGWAAGVAVAGPDQPLGRGNQFVVPGVEAFRKSDAARHGFIQIDGWGLLVRRAKIGRASCRERG